jgi:hypothetical protein
MPYSIQKSGSGYKVEGPGGKHYSKHAQSKAMATRQMRALYASESRTGAFKSGASHQ